MTDLTLTFPDGLLDHRVTVSHDDGDVVLHYVHDSEDVPGYRVTMVLPVLLAEGAAVAVLRRRLSEPMQLAREMWLASL